MKTWIKNHMEKLKTKPYYTKKQEINQKINLTILIIEALFILWVANTLYGCPCALRTCDLRSYSPQGELMWEATNLDCNYVQKHINTPLLIEQEHII